MGKRKIEMTGELRGEDVKTRTRTKKKKKRKEDRR